MKSAGFIDETKIGNLYSPDLHTASQAGKSAGFSRSDPHERRIMLLLVDLQVDFVHEEGALSVPGAVEDLKRTIRWILSHAGMITEIAASLDSHLPLQIFFPPWWVNVEGENPSPYTALNPEEVMSGKWIPNYQPAWSRDYVKALREQAKRELMIWPFHTMLGTQGHSLMPALYEAITYHSAGRQTQPTFIIKGTIPQTEYYSILEPEVKVPEDPRGSLNDDFLTHLISYDAVYVAGQAKSHCVLETMHSIVKRYGDRPDIMEKFRLLIDCTSSVVHPEIDFEALSQEAYQEFTRAGVRMVTTEDPVP